MSRLTISLVTSLLSLTGCAPNPVLRAAELSDQTAEIACECWDQFDFDDHGDCVEAIGSPRTPTEEQCLADAYGDNARELEPAAKCGLDVAETFHDCVLSIVACNDAAFDACKDEADEALDRCPTAPASASRALLACLDEDSDGDGIFDSEDRCDGAPEDFDGVEDDDGCPDHDAYESCWDDGDCPATSLCDLAGRRFCSVYCSSDADCPSANGFAGVCVSPAFERDFVCHQGCARDDDCVDAGARCESVDGIGVCM